MEVQNKRVLVVGLARSGLAVARALARRGAVVTVSDIKPPSEFRDLLPELIKEKIGMELGSQREETFLRNEIIVTSPGVPWDLPQLQAARERKIVVYPEVEVASWFLDGPLVGITGSNGKTTTTSLLGDMLKASGFPTFVGGNIGNALSSAVDNSEPGTRFVTELSSFQLEGIHNFRPHVAVILNLSPNHLDRHPTLEAYADAKRQIFRNQGGEDYTVLNADDPWVAGLRPTVTGTPVLFSRTRELPSGVFAAGGKVYYRVRHLERVLFETRDVRLKGDFNLEDVLAATTAACLLGADFTAIRKAVREFKAVEHRLEFVREIKGVDFYNNSKATSVDATLKSLGAFDRGVHLIMGGKDKGAPYTPLIPLIKERVRDVLLIGVAAPIIAEQLQGSAELLPAGDLETAVYEAFARARPGDTVLLAPACSSFDQFHDYEERGRIFKDLVHKLASEVATGRTARPQIAPLFGAKAVEVEASVAIPSLRPASVDPLLKADHLTPLGELQPHASDAADRTTTQPIAEKSPAEKRTAARKRAKELASTQAWKAAEPPAVKVTASEPTAISVTTESRSSRETILVTPPEVVAEPITGTESTIAGPDTRPDDAAPITRVPTPAPESLSPREEATEADSEDAAPSPTIAARTSDVASSLDEASQLAESHDEPLTHRDASESAREPNSGHESMPWGKGSAPSNPHRIELSYVYEVDAVDMPGTDSQVVQEDEPTILVSSTPESVSDDEVLPFEARPAENSSSGVGSPKSVVKKKSGGRSAKSGAPEVSESPDAKKQPKLFKSGNESER